MDRRILRDKSLKLGRLKKMNKRIPLKTITLFAMFLAVAASVESWGFEVKDDREVSARKPVVISASQLFFDRLKGLTTFKGKVKAVHNEVVLTSDWLRAITENEEAAANGHVKVTDPVNEMKLTCGNLEYQDRMNLMTAHDQPLLSCLDENGLPITVLGRQMEIDSEKKTVEINQNVEILHEGGKAEAQKATYLAKQDKFILEEAPKMTISNGQISGRRIISNMGTNRSLFVEGMADAVFYPMGQQPDFGAKGKEGSPSSTPTSSGPGGITSPTNPSSMDNHGAAAAETPVSTPVTTAPLNFPNGQMR